PLKIFDEDELELVASQFQNSRGIGNTLKLSDEDIHQNIKNIQLRNGLPLSESFNSLNGIHVTVEMETGTGKTYVYLRSIFEMNRLYGFTKFIIVVPSIAIKEGTRKSIEMTSEHFRELYENVSFDSFVYDSGKLSHVRDFATSPDIQIMIINIDAFRKSFNNPEKENTVNIIHRFHDRMNEVRPIEYIQETNPIVIVDEPQSVDTTEKSKEAIASLNPLCTLRYSATHADKHHMLYKLDSVDAYERKLVKQIEVAGIEVMDGHNTAYIKLLSVDNRKTPISARIEIDSRLRTGAITRRTIKIKGGDDVFEKSNGRDIYDGYIIEDISCEKGREFISFTSKPEIVNLGQSIGDGDRNEYQRLQIRKTIEEHVDKETRLRPQGIKVLSLFFIDRVANYRYYDKEGNPQKGKFALMFEEEYARTIRKAKYRALGTPGENSDTADIAAAHNGYFAIDRKKDTSGHEMLKDASGKTVADESAYNLIMKDKEKLLSFDSKLKFIFSHSALKEGWDNPNIFQICTLNESASLMKKRQEIGRGLRICVNQNGDRVHGFEVNTLTVMANESYQKFAEQLQKEIEEEEGIRFGVVEERLFANIPVSTHNYRGECLGIEASMKLWNALKTLGYIDAGGKVQDSLKAALQNDTLELPKEFDAHRYRIAAVLKKISANINIKNRDNKKKVLLNKAVFLSPEFKELWNRIKYKTTFRVNFNADALAAKCAEEIAANLRVGSPRFVYRKAKTEIDRGGVRAEQTRESVNVSEARFFALPDVITYLQNETNLTRQTIVRIITDSGRLASFKKNPQKFIEQVSTIIRHQMRGFLVDGLKYEKIGNDHYYAQELFKKNELFGYLRKNMVNSRKSVFDHVVYDSDIERTFAAGLEQSDDITLYAKLPSWFSIPTPLGSYNPDWAVLVEADGAEKLYFVVETKGTLFADNLRLSEKAKIDCGKKHFAALGSEVRFTVAKEFDDFSSGAWERG
ncbi:MAG: type III restriction-modification system endonuclease, partial [Salinispira sp.]